MNKLDKQYQNLLKDILENGIIKNTRNGKTLSVFGRSIRYKFENDDFPLLTTKKMAWKSIGTELKWFLKGDTNIQYLLENNCYIWTGDAYKNYINNPKIKKHWESGGDIADIKQFEELILKDKEFAEKWGELGPIYGKQWRKWRDWRFDRMHFNKDETLATYTPIELDQIKILIKELKTNPDSRRLMVSAWNVAEMDSMVLPPCHYGFQVYTRELNYKERYNIWFNNNYETGMEVDYNNVPDFDNSYYTPTPSRAISLMWNQRSVDTFLGLPFNIASYGMLLKLIAKEVNMVAEELIGNLGDVHLYKNHIKQANEQISRTSFKLPKLILSNVDLLKGNFDYEIINYYSHPSIKAPLSN